MRVSVVGSSGSGKSTFARELSVRLGVPHVELDAIYHQANWTPLSDDEFRARVAGAAAGDAWVIDGNYGAVRPLVLERATDVVWLDYSRFVVMTRVLRRSVSRAFVNRELWNGNKESVRNWVDPGHPIRWAWSQFDRKRVEYEARFNAPECAHLRVARLRSPHEADAWLAQISAT